MLKDLYKKASEYAKKTWIRDNKNVLKKYIKKA
jgi:hypothetical protein